MLLSDILSKQDKELIGKASFDHTASLNQNQLQRPCVKQTTPQINNKTLTNTESHPTHAPSQMPVVKALAAWPRGQSSDPSNPGGHLMNTCNPNSEARGDTTIAGVFCLLDYLRK